MTDPVQVPSPEHPATAVGESAASTPSSDNVHTPDNVDTPVNEDDTITDSMIQEENKLHEESAKEEKEKIEKLKEKAADEYNDTVNKQRFQRLNFLIERSTLYANFLSQKLEKQQNEARAKAAALEAKLAQKEKERANEAEVKVETEIENDAAVPNAAHATRASTRSGGRTTEATTETKKRGAASKKRKVDESEYSLADYVDKDSLKKQKSGDAAVQAPIAPTNGTGPITKPTISARQPSLVTGGVLRDYQLAGVEWMVSLYENGLNGILADEMGLGKTLQTISFLAYLREKGVWGPFLVVAPLSTLANWVSEFERFTPTVPVVLYHGMPEQRSHIRNKRFRKLDPSFPVCVTSYEIVMNDRKFLQKYQWKFIIVDEGHRLKNMNCKLIRELKSYHSANRLLLTGTPLQNNLSELWSLLNFLLPDIFDDLESFQEWFDFSDINAKEGQERILGEESQSGIVSSLHHILKPFLLRRIKTDVEHSLPKKREYLLYAPLTPIQKEWYDAVRAREIRDFLIEKKCGVDDALDSDSRVPGSAESESVDGSEDAQDDVETVLEEEEKKEKKAEQISLARRRQQRVSTVSTYEEKSDRKYFKELEESGSSKLEELKAISRLESARAIDVKRATKSISNMKLMNVVMQLRKVCNHPFLFEWPTDKATGMPVLSEELLNSSGKMLVLDRILPALFDRGHKVLIFSQFTTMLDIIQDWAENYKSWQCCRIDGHVKQEDRRRQIAEFNTSPQMKLFLLSTRAGGLGINLTSADTVIIFDSDWNPQMDLQAQDRVHRIGQTKPVMIYRLVTANTVEGKIIERAASKRKLEKLVIHKGKFKQPPTPATPGSGVDRASTLSELARILEEDDHEKFQVASKGDEVISDKDLEMLLDRSEAAYSNHMASGTFKTVEEERDDQNDILKVDKMAPVV
ncbi:hypothetical protein BGZ93_002389 [Podila epicladia]|nr:hypothetical protein BGZ92_006289 [Podila epicladia]KAG0097600.1 hypothetical protein BGZ93_002389 [Podila epicladia]